MGVTRREFIRRLIAASVLSAVGAVSFWELLQSPAPAGQSQSLTLLPPPSTTTEQSSSSSSSKSTGQSQSDQSSSSSQSSSSQSIPPGYVLVTPMSALSGKASAYFNHPVAGTSILVNVGGSWRAFNAACTHAGCTVQYTGSSIYCPCHAGYFSPSNGAVQSGPPPTALPEFGVLIQNADLFVSTAAVN